MSLDKYEKVFLEVLRVEKNELAGLEYQAIQAWDSVGHMELMANLEDAFNIMFDMDEIIDFSSYEKGKEILKKHDVVF